MINKNDFAKKPPLGWNSWDVYGAAVTEEELMRNANFLAEHLKQYGWEYVVCDIQWFEPTASSMDYHPFTELVMDQWSRLLPAENRFPSAAGGAGFKPIADRIHDMGLKFGIHILRGIPRQAVHANTPILGTTATAREIAHPYSACRWNTDMYGVDPTKEGAQAYYDSIFELYASWGVDFVKVDDIANVKLTPEEPYSARGEVELIQNAIQHCGRPMVLSLSPGPAVVEEHAHLCQYANMWRMTDDFWDDWTLLKAMFERCEAWAPYVSEGCWPDCDMLPIGHIALRNEERWTRFTRDEQLTMLSLWGLFRSPLMIGTELPDADAFTLSLLTNAELLDLNQNGSGGTQILRDDAKAIWECHDGAGRKVIGWFNLMDEPQQITEDYGPVHDLWTKEEGPLDAVVPPHGVRLFRPLQQV